MSPSPEGWGAEFLGYGLGEVEVGLAFGAETLGRL
jgi:hypothetical protein